MQGRHEPIITVEEYERVQKIMKSKTGKLKNPTTGRKLTGVTPPKTVWGRLMICSCGRRFNRRKWRTNANGEKFFGYQCYGTTQTGTIKSRLKRGLPIDGICQSPMIAEWKLQMMANYIFRHFLTNKQKVLEIANSLLEEHIGDTEVQVQDNSKLIEQKQRELDRANIKRRNLVDLLSNYDISREDYQEARAEVDRQIDKLKAEIEELTPVVEETKEEEIDYESKITVLRYALEQYTNFDTEGDIPESVIEAFVEKIEVSKDCFRWHLRGDFGGDSPIPMNVDGNRKKGATISPQYIIPPANFGDSYSLYAIDSTKPTTLGTTWTVSEVLSDWSESTITYASSQELDISEAYTAEFTVQSLGRNEIDITGMIDRIRYGLSYGFRINYISGKALSFSSSECTTASQLPMVIVEYVTQSPSDSMNYVVQNLENAGKAYLDKQTGMLYYEPYPVGIGGNRLPIMLNSAYYPNHWTVHMFPYVTPGHVFIDRWGSQYKFVRDMDSETEQYICNDLPEYIIKVENGVTYLESEQYVYTMSSFSGLCRKVKDKQSDNEVIVDQPDYIPPVTGIPYYFYDGSGRKYKYEMVMQGSAYVIPYIEVYNGDNTQVTERVEYTYSGKQRISETRYVYENGQRVNDAEHVATVFYTYDADGNLSSVTAPGGYKLCYTYEAKRVGSMMPQRVIKIEEFNGSEAGDWIMLSYGKGETSMTDASGRTVIEQYDRSGNVTFRKNGQGRALIPVDSEAEAMALRNNRFIQDYQEAPIAPNLFQNHLNSMYMGMQPSRFYNLSGYGASVIYADTSVQYHGQNSISVNKGESASAQYLSVSVSKNAEETTCYSFDAFVKTSGFSGASSGGIYLNILASGSGKENYSISSKVITQETDWQQLIVSAVVPEGYSQVSFRFCFDSGTGTAYFARQRATETDWLMQYNLLNNGDMNDNPIMGHWWNASSGESGTYKAYTSVSLSGGRDSALSEKAIKLPASNQREILYQSVSVAGGQNDTFSLGGWGKAAALPVKENRQYALAYKFIKTAAADTSAVQQDWQYISFNTDVEDWQYLQSFITAPYPYSAIYVGAAYSCQLNDAYFDGFELYLDSRASQAEEAETGSGIIDESVKPSDLSDTITDDYGRVVQSVSSGGVVTAYSYDAYGNLRLKSITDGERSMSAEYSYTENGNYAASVKDMLGGLTVLSYNQDNGLLQSITDPLGNTLTYAYNPKGELIRVQSGASQVAYDYDAAGRLLTVSVGDMVYTAEYDLWGAFSAIKLGNTQLLVNTYSSIAQGRRLLRTDYANGQYVDYGYTASGRLASIAYNGESEPTFVYSYDDWGNLRSSIDNTSGLMVKYEYDENLSLLSVTETGLTCNYTHTYDSTSGKMEETINGVTFVTYFSGNVDGEQRGVRYASGAESAVQHEYTYDGLGRRKSEIAYAENGQGTAQELFAKEYSYKDLAHYKTTPLVDRMILTVDGRTLLTDYRYNANGFIVAAGACAYHYDGLGQLIRTDDETAQRTTAYAYDSRGNMLSRQNYAYISPETEINGVPLNTVSFAYDNSAWADQLTSFGGKAIAYDVSGNPLSWDGWSYVWRGGELASVSKNGVSAVYRYNAQGVRTQKTVNGTTTYFTLADGVLTHQASGSDEWHFYYDSEGAPVGFSCNGAHYAYITNLQGDVLYLVDSSGAIAAQYQYDEWGKITAVLNSSGTDVSADASHIANLNPLRYRGYYYDAETGLYYLQSRYYNPEWCRFISADHFLYTSEGVFSGNLYIYCRNTPVMMKDDAGAKPVSIWSNVQYGNIEVGSMAESALDWGFRATLLLQEQYRTNIAWQAQLENNRKVLAIQTNALMASLDSYMNHTKTLQGKIDRFVDIIAWGELGTSMNDGFESASKYGNWYAYGTENVVGIKDKNGVQVKNETGPWCAKFVSWCAYQAGLNVVSKFKNCVTGMNLYNQKGLYRDLSYIDYKPCKGDIVFFYSPSQKKICHVGIVVAYDKDKDLVYTIEGNQKDMVDSINYKRCYTGYTKMYIVGFGVNGGTTSGVVPTQSRKW